MGPDLANPKWMYLKAIGFGLIASLSAAGLVANSLKLETFAMILLLVWSTSRLYYFCFYVIERYIDPDYKFAGLGSTIVYLIRKRPVNDQDR